MAKEDKGRVRLGERELKFKEVNSIRFAVGSADARRSSTWSVGGNKKGDFYFSTRTLGGILKTSLHLDGRCHYAFTAEDLGKPQSLASKNRSRLLDRWNLPEAPFCCASRILMPETELRAFPTKDSDSGGCRRHHLNAYLWLLSTCCGRMRSATVGQEPIRASCPLGFSRHGLDPLGW